jgi:hypothetical protein
MSNSDAKKTKKQTTLAFGAPSTSDTATAAAESPRLTVESGSALIDKCIAELFSAPTTQDAIDNLTNLQIFGIMAHVCTNQLETALVKDIPCSSVQGAIEELDKSILTLFDNYMRGIHVASIIGGTANATAVSEPGPSSSSSTPQQPRSTVNGSSSSSSSSSKPNHKKSTADDKKSTKDKQDKHKHKKDKSHGGRQKTPLQVEVVPRGDSTTRSTPSSNSSNNKNAGGSVYDVLAQIESSLLKKSQANKQSESL